MHELEIIAKQAEVTALAIHERIARIHDALHALHDLTLTLYEATQRDNDAVQKWLDTNGFDFDEYGYYERIDVLKRARAGDVDSDIQIYYVNEPISRDYEALFRMYALRNLPRSLRTIAQNLPGLAWNYYQDATGMVIVFPMHDPCTVVPPDFNWHEYHTYKLVSPENNPERRILWTSPNIDYGGKGLMVAPSIPLYRDNTLFGVWSFDVPVASLIRDSLLETVVAGQQSFIVDRDGILVAHDSLETLVAPSLGDVYRMPISELGGGFGEIDLHSLWATSQTKLIDANGDLNYVIACPIKLLDWLLVVAIPAQGMIQKMEQSFLDAFEHARAGNFAHRMESGDQTEMNRLAEGFNKMASAVQATLKGKEKAILELEESRDRSRAILEASPVGLALTKSSGEVVAFNPELANIIGIPPYSADELDIMQHVPKELNAEFKQTLNKAITRSQAGPIESELLNKEGHYVPVRLLARRLELREGTRILLGIENITETRKLQSQLLHSQKMDAIGKLASGVAHDFNNILTVIMSNAGVLKLKLKASEDVLSHIEDIELASSRAAALTAQLLTFSRQELIQTGYINPAVIISESEQLLRQFVNEDIKFDIVIDEEIPMVRGDVAQFLQIVMNLVINARDALHGRGGHIELRSFSCQLSSDAKGVCISVSDDGPGIETDMHANIFKPFFTTKSHGVGMGLATAQDIVTSMGGAISVESVPGTGATFLVELPAAIRAEQTEIIANPSLDIPVTGYVLVVDDEPLVREACSSALMHAGIMVRAASNGNEALVILEELGDRVSILVTDVVMPVMGGRELAEKATELYPRLPILFITGYMDDTILRHGIESESVELLRKPFSTQIFIDVIKRNIAKAGVHQQVE